MITTPTHRVVLGGLVLADGENPVPYVDGYTLEVFGEDTQWGNPQPVATTLLSMMMVGSLVAREGDQNRQPVLLVGVEADANDGNALGRAEAALAGVTDRPTTLEWTPPQAGSEMVVFDIVDSSLDHVMDEADEVNVRRVFRVTLNAFPHGRWPDLVAIPAIPPGVETLTMVSDLDTDLANWDEATALAFTEAWNGGSFDSSVWGGAPADGGTYGLADVLANSGPSTAYKLAGFRREGLSLDAAATPYIAVDYAWVGGVVPSGRHALLQLHWISDEGYTVAAQVASVALSETVGGVPLIRAFFRVPDDDITVLYVLGATRAGAPTQLALRRVQRAASLPSYGTTRQQARVFDVPGTRPTRGSIDVASPTAGLDDVLVYTHRFANLGYQPPLSPYYDASTYPRSTTASYVSGKSHNLLHGPGTWYSTATNFPKYTIPASALPAGEFLLMALLEHTGHNGTPPFQGTLQLTVHVETKMGSLVVGSRDDSIWWTFVEDVPVLVPLALLNLPLHPVGPEGTVVIQVGVTGGASQSTQVVAVDEMWLFHTDGNLTVVENSLQKRLSIRAPSAEEPAGSLWLGDEADGSDWYSANGYAKNRDHHELQAGQNGVFTVTRAALDAATSATFYPRVHTHTYRLDP